jgi:hypothetical protein
MRDPKRVRPIDLAAEQGLIARTTARLGDAASGAGVLSMQATPEETQAYRQRLQALLREQVYQKSQQDIANRWAQIRAARGYKTAELAPTTLFQRTPAYRPVRNPYLSTAVQAGVKPADIEQGPVKPIKPLMSLTQAKLPSPMTGGRPTPLLSGVFNNPLARKA